MVPRPVATPSPPLVIFLSTTSALGPSMSILIIIPTHDHALRCPCPSMPPPRGHGVRSRPLALACPSLGPLPTAPAWQYRDRRGAPVLIAVHQSRQVAFLGVPEYLGLPDYVLGHLRAIIGHFPRKARPGAAPGTSQGRRPAMQGPYWTLIPHRSARRPERHEATAPLPPLFNTLRP